MRQIRSSLGVFVSPSEGYKKTTVQGATIRKLYFLGHCLVIHCLVSPRDWSWWKRWRSFDSWTSWMETTTANPGSTKLKPSRAENCGKMCELCIKTIEGSTYVLKELLQCNSSLCLPLFYTTLPPPRLILISISLASAIFHSPCSEWGDQQIKISKHFVFMSW